MTVPSFGTRLRQQRERRQVALSAIAAETKIKPSLLEALERDDVSYWPTGIFRRAYIRAYAAAIGLDPDGTVREFLAVHPDTADVLPPGATVWPEPEESSADQSAKGLRRIVTSARLRPGSGGQAAPAMLRPPQQTAPSGPEALPVSLPSVAHLCARLARIRDTREAAAILADAAQSLGAIGLIVWRADRAAAALIPALIHGYPDTVRRRLAAVRADAANAVAAAFRASDVRIVEGDGVSGALVVPIVGRAGCTGVLALELRDGTERREEVRAFATILASQLAVAHGNGDVAL